MPKSDVFFCDFHLSCEMASLVGADLMQIMFFQRPTGNAANVATLRTFI